MKNTNVVPSHHDTARTQVADGTRGLQIWRVAANMLNEQSRTANTGWSSSMEVGRGVNNSSLLINRLITKCYAGSRTWTKVCNDPENGKWMRCLEHGMLGVSIGQVHWKQ